jgi:hypothetical protein
MVGAAASSPPPGVGVEGVQAARALAAENKAACFKKSRLVMICFFIFFLLYKQVEDLMGIYFIFWGFR